MAKIISPEQDWKIRVAAIEWVRKYAEKCGDRGIVSSDDMREGFEYQGERVVVMNLRRGIHTPRQCAFPLSICTSYKHTNPYQDKFDSDGGIPMYDYEGGGINSAGNYGLDQLRERRWPLIYFFGIGPRRYLALAPVQVCRNYLEEGKFGITLGDMQNVLEEQPEVPDLTDAQRDYRSQQMRIRIHQAQFRKMILEAYKTSCALCRLGHKPLLDAAHIRPFSEAGPSRVSNGMALCKLHHAAYDEEFLGISPDYKIIIRRDILRERDGPTLQHSIKELHEGSIYLPGRKDDEPNKDFLAERYERFLEEQRKYN